MNVADVLEQTAAMIEKRGKAVGTYGDEQGRICVIGAFVELIPLETSMHLCEECFDVLEGVIGGPGTCIGGWNDRTPTPEVLATLRATAAVWRAKNEVLAPQTLPAQAGVDEACVR